jgi:hypothetical protein
MEKMTDKICWANFRRVFANCNVLTLTVDGRVRTLGRQGPVFRQANRFNFGRFAESKGRSKIVGQEVVMNSQDNPIANCI